jgi:hypothetical protein
VIEGEDGTYRIGRVTEIAAETVDDAYQSKIANDGIDLENYRGAVLADVIHDKLEAKLVAEVSQPGPQRHVQEIFIAQASPDLAADAIKTRHILYSPNDDPGSSRRRRPTSSSRTTPPCSTRSRAPTATRAAPRV